ncbi:MAG: hypothetical protein GYB31_10170 [Bacteroidetes bacterium]|nr:hypothetical protein [Bacteroidota bacterium]
MNRAQKTGLLFSLLFSFTALQAQPGIDRASLRVCNCYASANEDPTVLNEELFASCLGKALEENIGQIIQETGIDTTNTEEVQDLGDLVTETSLSLCPEAFQQALYSITDSYTVHPIRGKIVRIEDGTFWKIVIADARGNEYQLLLLSHFEEAMKKLNHVMSDDADGQSFVWVYREAQYFDKANQKFESYKELIDIRE